MAVKVNIEKNFRDFSLKVDFEGSSAAIGLLGASGSGKSMTLRCIAGIETPDKGRIVINGKTVFDSEKGINLKPQKRRIGYLFQNYALLEDKSIAYNLEIVFSGRMKREEKRQRIMEALEAVGLKGMEKKKVCQCSGGEQQRAAMARLLLKPCELILADEPTGNLDPQNKEKVYELLKEMNVQGKTVIIVTHDMELAKRCDRILVMDEGKLSTAA